MDVVIIVKSALLNSGAAWVLWFLAALSVVSLAVCIERWHAMRQGPTDLGQLAARLETQLAAGNVEEALQTLQDTPSTAAAIARAGLNLAGHGRLAAEQAMRGRMALERERMSRRLVFLGTVGNNAPFVGLFGTVVGIIQAFEHLGASAATPQVGQAASAAVMTSLAEALVATAVGIFVAIPAVAAYNAFQRRIASILASAEVLSRLVLAFLGEAVAKGPAGRPEPLPAPQRGQAARPREVAGGVVSAGLATETR
jgi:biopolymer transport protein ExbB